jgi:membrane fusion protein (multidrug efflux system)
MLICMAILFGSILIWKIISKVMLKRYLSSQSQVVMVTGMTVKPLSWQPNLKATGTVRAINGVDVTTSLAGSVAKIYFTPGSWVSEGTLLVQLNADAEIGQLQSLQAQERLAQITYDRDQKQFTAHAVSKQTVDSDFETLKSLQGQVAEQQAIVDKKAIRAPFSGRIGICNVNLGQYILPGNPIASLQSLDPVYIDFYLPQQALAKLKMDQQVSVKSDIFPEDIFTGKITTINPSVDQTTRNVTVEAILANPNFKLVPGMFAPVAIDVDTTQNKLTVPQTTISFNPYGSIVYILIQDKKDDQGRQLYIANQKFVTTGETRGDQIVVTSGLKENDMVVTSGQLKLKNHSIVAINNKIEPKNNPDPSVSNEHE